jgi:copper resistance protein B
MTLRPGRVALAAALVLWGSAVSARAQDTSKPAVPHEDHSAHQRPPQPEPPPAGLPPITDADRAAAFPPLDGGHAVHDDGVNYFVRFDRVEWQTGSASTGSWDNASWIGGDINRLWVRSEGRADQRRIAAAYGEALVGRAIHPWWDVVAGVRQDFRPGPARTWAAVGVQGVAPYWFDVQATAYIGESGRTLVRVETEYELLFTNRLILQPGVEMEVHGKSDPARGIGSGLSSLDAGLRLRYEVRRELAPYLGVAWNRKFFGTADLAEAAGDEIGRTQLVLGLRMWL